MSDEDMNKMIKSYTVYGSIQENWDDYLSRLDEVQRKIAKDMLELIQEDKRQMIILIGDSGIGKTFLLHEYVVPYLEPERTIGGIVVVGGEKLLGKGTIWIDEYSFYMKRPSLKSLRRIKFFFEGGGSVYVSTGCYSDLGDVRKLLKKLLDITPTVTCFVMLKAQR